MSFKKLEEKGWIEKIPVDKREIENLFQLVSRDIKVSCKLVKIDLDWAYNLAYNSLLQASFALMRSFGYRARGATHKVAIAFLRETLGKKFARQITQLDRARQKRRQATYVLPGAVSEIEAKNLIKLAQKFTSELRKRSQKQLGKIG